MRTKLTNGLIGRMAIQCMHPESGQTGTFLYAGDSHRNADNVLSPCCADIIALHSWARANGWIPYADAYVYEPAISAKMTDGKAVQP